MRPDNSIKEKQKSKQQGLPFYINNETGRLHKVLMHAPDEGIGFVTPSSAVDLLYEDIVFLPKMKEEHDVYTRCISFFTGKENIFEFRNLLSDVLKEYSSREELLYEIFLIENSGKINRDEFLEMDSLLLADCLISGKKGYLNPLPNLIFTRDIGVVVNDHIVVTSAAKFPRKRESILTSLVLNHHPLFRDYERNKKILDLTEWIQDPELSLEGGDIMMLGNDHLLMAESERTTRKGIENLIALLFERKVVNRVSYVNLPKSRYCMHFDTIFTAIKKNSYVAFEPVVANQSGAYFVEVFESGVKGTQKFSSVYDFLKNENPQTEFIYCGGGEFPYDEREQWTDGCNLFAVKDGVCFTYDRNTKTNEALKNAGYSIIPATEFLQKNNKDPEQVNNTIITLPSSELSRARGGPHCLTMPLLRS